MKNLLCCVVFVFVAAIAWSQTTFEPLVSKNDWNVIPRTGESEIIIEKRTKNGNFTVSINGKMVAHIIGNTFEKIIVPNGNNVLQFQMYKSTDSRGNPTERWIEYGSPKSLMVNSNSNTTTVSIAGDWTLNYINITKVESLQAQSLLPRSKSSGNAHVSGIEGAVENGCSELIKNIPDNAIIAVVNIASDDREIVEFVVEEIEYLLVNSGGSKIVDRKRLDVIREEMNFQMSGMVDDNSAVSIGKHLGANIVITGSISGSDAMRRLRLKAIDVKTAQILAMASEKF